MSANRQPLIGSVLERKRNAVAQPPKPIDSHRQGFPSAQHRSKSTFGRSRESARGPNHAANETRPSVPPIVVSNLQGTKEVESKKPIIHDWREQISVENETRVADMTDEEREAEKQEILKRFGTGIGDVLMRARQAREKNAQDRRPTQGATTRTTSPPAQSNVGHPLEELPEGVIFLDSVSEQSSISSGSANHRRRAFALETQWTWYVRRI